jgi:outer membrane protein assembly factor BamA
MVETVPFYERYYLGGLYSLRGFRYRAISPREFESNFGHVFCRAGGRQLRIGLGRRNIVMPS